MNKKQSPEWYIAGTHWLTSMVSSAIFGAIILFILAAISQDVTILSIGTIIIYPVVMWLAVRYSANFVNKRYIIVNPDHIVTLSTVFLVIVAGGYRGYSALSSSGGMLVIANAIGFFVALVIFYFASKKYVKKTT